MDTIKLVSHSQSTELSPAKRVLLEKRLRGVVRSSSSAASAIPPRSPDSPVPLSFSQERLWFIHQMDPVTCAYNLPCGLRIEGELNVPALEKALNRIVERHEILRTAIRSVEGRPVQLVQPVQAAALPLIDLQEYPSSDRSAHLDQLVQREVQRTFNLEEGPLFRCVLFRLNQREHLFLSARPNKGRSRSENGRKRGRQSRGWRWFDGFSQRDGCDRDR